jgi:hypothetical protein
MQISAKPNLRHCSTDCAKKGFIGVSSQKDFLAFDAYILQKCIAKLHIGLMSYNANVNNHQLKTS